MNPHRMQQEPALLEQVRLARGVDQLRDLAHRGVHGHPAQLQVHEQAEAQPQGAHHQSEDQQGPAGPAADDLDHGEVGQDQARLTAPRALALGPTRRASSQAMWPRGALQHFGRLGPGTSPSGVTPQLGVPIGQAPTPDTLATRSRTPRRAKVPLRGACVPRIPRAGNAVGPYRPVGEPDSRHGSRGRGLPQRMLQRRVLDVAEVVGILGDQVDLVGGVEVVTRGVGISGLLTGSRPPAARAPGPRCPRPSMPRPRPGPGARSG